MTHNSLSQPPFPREGRHCIKLVLKENADALDFLKLNQELKANVLIEETRIYLSAFSLLENRRFIYGDQHYIKVFLREQILAEAALRFADSLRSHPLVEEAYFRVDRSTFDELEHSVHRRLEARQRDFNRWVPFFRKKGRGIRACWPHPTHHRYQLRGAEQL